MNKVRKWLHVARAFGARDGCLRLSYELQRDTGVISRRLRRVRGWESWNLRQIAPNISCEELLCRYRTSDRRFFFHDIELLAPELRKALGPEGERAVAAEADQIIAGQLPFFGALSFATGFPPDWFRNPLTGESVSPHRSWTGMRFASDDYGDLKFILEPSRFLWIYPLVRAYALAGNERFPEAFWNAIEDWARHNPPMEGPLWICGQESSLRIVAWSFALHAFLRSPATTPGRFALLLSMIAAHAWRTEQTVGYARSQRSNHLFSEAVGLWTAGTLYPELSFARRCQDRGARLLREALLDQITSDGAYLQDSFNYQRMVLHLLLWCIRLAQIHGARLAPEIPERTAAALEFIGGFIDPISGAAPNHGSNDGSYVLPLASCHFGDFRPLLRLGSCVLNQPSTLPVGPWDEAALWFGGRIAQSATAIAAPSVSSSTDSGYYRIGSQKSWAFVRAGHYTRRPFQADQLHVDLWWDGLNIARDAGTYLYNGEPPWDNGLARTAVHNTVTIDGNDQMERAGRFLWVDWAQATGRTHSMKGHGFADCFEGEHGGYRRFGVKHRRTVQYLSDDLWVIVDDLLGESPHEARLHWLVPDWPLDVTEASDRGTAERPCAAGPSAFCATLTAGAARVRWEIAANVPGAAAVVRDGTVVRGNASPDDVRLLGRQSPTYGELTPALSILYSVRAPLPIRMITAICADDAFALVAERDQWILTRNGEQLYSVSFTPAWP